MRVYLLKNLVTGKGYVGQTIQPLHKRLADHIWTATTVNKEYKCAIHNAIAKYGIENFKIEVLQECSTQDELNSAEVHWIAVHSTLVPKGYNLREGGGSRGKASSETRLKMSAAAKGQIVSQETRLKIAAARKGRKSTEETKLKMSLALKGKSKNNGSGFSNEHRKALSLAAYEKMKNGGKEKVSGEYNGKALLTWEVVGKIRCDSEILSTVAIALKYGISQSQASLIMSNKRWVVPEVTWVTKKQLLQIAEAKGATVSYKIPKPVKVIAPVLAA